MSNHQLSKFLYILFKVLIPENICGLFPQLKYTFFEVKTNLFYCVKYIHLHQKNSLLVN